MEALRRPGGHRHRNTGKSQGRSSRETDIDGIPVDPLARDVDDDLGLVWERSLDLSQTNPRSSSERTPRNGEQIINETVSGENMLEQGAIGGIRPSAPEVEEIDALLDDYKVEKDKVVEQHALIESRRDYVKQSKENERTRIISLFSNILDILSEKEASLLCQLDEKYKPEEDKTADLLTSVEDALESIRAEIIVAEAVRAGDSHFNDISVTDMKPLLCDIKAGNEEREEDLKDNEIQNIEVNDDVIGVIDGLEYVKIDVSETVDENNERDGADIDEVDEGNAMIDNSDEQPATMLDSETLDEVNQVEEGILNDAVFSETLENESENAITVAESATVIAFSDSFSGADDSANVELVDNEHPTPSAPPQPQAEEPPPPYWQAVGLSGPGAEDITRSSPAPLGTEQAPVYSNTASRGQRSNELVLYHSFPLKKQHDARAPKPVALSWDLECISVADRANSKIKFFSSSGGVLTEMYLGGCEIYDIAFIEASYYEIRYVVTVPRAKTFIFISIINGQTVQLLQKLKFQQGYTSVAKGPTGHTLVGANALPNLGASRVDIINYQGEVLRSFTHTCTNIEFAYPRCVKVFKQAIVVADWKLNLVMVFLEDGTALGQYNGIPHYPLKEPSSLTLDHCGNIMVVDGKTGNIHVIDLHCRPVQIIKSPRGQSLPKLLAFHTGSHRLAVARQSGDIAIYDFKGGYWAAPLIGDVGYSPFAVEYSEEPTIPNVLPLVEGMLPSTIANIGAGRQRQNSRSTSRPYMFHL